MPGALACPIAASRDCWPHPALFCRDGSASSNNITVVWLPGGWGRARQRGAGSVGGACGHTSCEILAKVRRVHTDVRKILANNT